MKFLATNVIHNAASMPEMLPEGAELFKGHINEKIEVTFTAPESTASLINPMGMVMFVHIGEEADDAGPVQEPRHEAEAETGPPGEPLESAS